MDPHSLAETKVNLYQGEAHIAPSPTKRRKTARSDVPTTASKPKQRKGKLSKLPDMPLDVLYEIFSHLHPEDLLKISWTTKAFRRVLTNTSFRSVWLTSLASVEGLPACPDGLNEVEYASVLFNPLCQCCFKMRTQISWTFCRRICKECQEIETASVCEAWAMLPNPCEAFKSFSSSRSLSQVLPTHKFLGRSRYRRSWDRVVFLRNDVKAFFGRVCADGLSEADIEAIVDEYAQQLKKRDKFASSGKSWEVRKEAEKDKVRERAKSLRYEKIIGKLKEEGWAEELENHPSTYAGLKYLSGIRIVRPLTNKTWEDLKRRALPWMNERKIQRIKRETTERILNRVMELSPILSPQLQHGQIDIGLRKEDIYWIPEIRAIITDGSAEEFELLRCSLVGRLPALAAGLKESRSTALLTLLPHQNQPTDELSLATTWFKCESTQCLPLRPEAALTHGCFMQSYSNAPESDREYMNLVGRTWALGPGISFHEKKAEFAMKLVLATGNDPSTMTHEDMDIQQYLFVHYSSPVITIGSFDLMIEKFESGSGEILEGLTTSGFS